MECRGILNFYQNSNVCKNIKKILFRDWIYNDLEDWHFLFATMIYLTLAVRFFFSSFYRTNDKIPKIQKILTFCRPKTCWCPKINKLTKEKSHNFNQETNFLIFQFLQYYNFMYIFSQYYTLIISNYLELYYILIISNYHYTLIISNYFSIIHLSFLY